MAQAIESNTTSRRRFLAVLGFAGASATTAAIAAPPKPQESMGHFDHPSEYLIAMQAIGWTPLAMYQRLEGGVIHRMGVNESAPSEELVMRTWGSFHAISMRSPVQTQCGWWEEVWDYLYDKGFREDVTPEPKTKNI